MHGRGGKSSAGGSGQGAPNPLDATSSKTSASAKVVKPLQQQLHTEAGITQAQFSGKVESQRVPIKKRQEEARKRAEEALRPAVEAFGGRSSFG